MSEQPEQPELKQCPFCKVAHPADVILRGESVPSYSASCYGCRTVGPAAGSREYAAELWNTRALSPTSDAQSDPQIEAIRARRAKVPEPPWFVAFDDAKDCGPHANSGLALVDTGRESDWPIARLCHWPVAEFIANAPADIDVLLTALVEARREIEDLQRGQQYADNALWAAERAWKAKIEELNEANSALAQAEVERDSLVKTLETRAGHEREMLITLETEQEQLRKLLTEVGCSGVEHDDVRLDYVTVQIPRDVWALLTAEGKGQG